MPPLTVFVRPLFLALALAAPGLADTIPQAGKLSVADYPSIQEAIDANPGKMLFVPPGDHEIDRAIRIVKDGSGLYGFGRIIQTNPAEAILSVSQATDVRVMNLTLTRKAGEQGEVSALAATGCENLRIENVQVVETRAPAGAINVDKCHGAVVKNCVVRNYVAISVEDRTGNPDAGYAFRALDGTGIQETGCVGMRIEGNLVEEPEFTASPELAKQYGLGSFTKKNAVHGRFISDQAWKEEYVPGWFQGSSITINGSEMSDYILVLGNAIDGGAQGFDVQSDHVTLAHNITNGATVGMKAMHGSRNTLVIGNQFSHGDINGVLLQPGVLAHRAGDKPQYPGETDQANIDGESIVAYNIVSDFGYGPNNWMWGNERYPFEFGTGQKEDDPPLRDVIVLGNILYDSGKDGVLVEGKPTIPPPRYKTSVVVIPDTPQGLKGPVNIKFSDNIFDPGQTGAFVPPSDPSEK